MTLWQKPKKIASVFRKNIKKFFFRANSLKWSKTSRKWVFRKWVFSIQGSPFGWSVTRATRVRFPAAAAVANSLPAKKIFLCLLQYPIFVLDSQSSLVRSPKKCKTCKMLALEAWVRGVSMAPPSRVLGYPSHPHTPPPMLFWPIYGARNYFYQISKLLICDAEFSDSSRNVEKWRSKLLSYLWGQLKLTIMPKTRKNYKCFQKKYQKKKFSCKLFKMVQNVEKMGF